MPVHPCVGISARLSGRALIRGRGGAPYLCRVGGASNDPARNSSANLHAGDCGVHPIEHQIENFRFSGEIETHPTAPRFAEP